MFLVRTVPLFALLWLLLINRPVIAEAAPPELIRSEPYRPRSGTGDANAPLFTRLGPESTRLTITNQIATWHDQKRLYLSSFACGSIALGDLDGDSLTDVFVAGGAEDNRLYLQADNLSFLDITAGLSIEGAGRWSAGAVILDIDDDGDHDLYVCHYDQPNQLFINHTKETGKLSFTEEAGRFKLDIADASLLPAFADYDLDGDLDLYLLTHRLLREGGRPAAAPPVEQKSGTLAITGELKRYYEVADHADAGGKWVYWEHGRPDRLLRNDGGSFKDVTATAGLSTAPATGNSALWWDFNEDGLPDLFVGNEDAPSLLYRNNGKGTFSEVAAAVLPPGATISRGATTLDANGDGRGDLMVATILGRTHYQRQSVLDLPARSRTVEHNTLYLSTGRPRFLEAGWLSGLARTGHTWSVKSGDYDLDGLEDLFFPTGCARNSRHGDLPKIGHEQLVGRTAWDNYETAAPELREANMAFRGTGGFPFEEVSAKWGLDLVGMSYSCAQGDLDNDGDLDLIVSGLEDSLYLFRNDSLGGNSVRVRLRGTTANRQGIGATVFATTPNGRQVREIRSASGYLSADDEGAHFGLGPHERVALLQIQWPGGALQEFKDLPANCSYTITEPPRKTAPPKRRAEPVFVARDSLSSHPDSSPARNDFEASPFLPFQLSRFGPSQAWGDADGDDKPDVYLGGGAGSPGNLLFNRSTAGGKPAFSSSEQRLFETHAEREDTATVFFDANGDGILDLYVGSGATGQEEGSSSLRDRLYMNRGSGRFEDESYRLPDLRENTSAVCAADFDRDGDLDLFVGYRCQVGRYPFAAGGRLLENDGKEFRDVTKEKAPSLSSAGMITSALWTDLDGDLWPDLVVAQDRGSIQIHANRQGSLASPSPRGMERLYGQWNGVAAADLDGDGDMDLAATNLGLNVPFPASPVSPDVLLAGEWEDAGKIQMIEAYRENDVWFPRRSLSFWRQTMPALFPEKMSYHSFASASLDGLFGMDRLRKATILKISEPRSGAFYNDGSGQFTFMPFPEIAQIAPAFGIALQDFDLDGRIDCYLAQNLSTVRPEEAPMAGGLGQLLRGAAYPLSPEERFVPVTAAESGIEVPGDGRSAAALDLNADGRPDLVAGLNGSAPITLVNRTAPIHPALPVVLRGPPGNSAGIGAKIVLIAQGLPLQTIEVRAGEGFLSSVSGERIFACPRGTGPEPVIKVIWPDGTVLESPVPATTTRMVLTYTAPAPVMPPASGLDPDLVPQ